jgi:hypothetical protein
MELNEKWTKKIRMKEEHMIKEATLGCQSYPEHIGDFGFPEDS